MASIARADAGRVGRLPPDLTATSDSAQPDDVHPHALATLGKQHYGMDNIRAVLSAAVVTHHSGMPYGTSGPWFLSTAEQLPWLGGVYALNEMYTVPMFFMLAGFQSYRSVYAGGSARFAHRRISRLGLPYAALLGVINPVGRSPRTRLGGIFV